MKRTKEWWGADVVPRIQWAIERSGLQHRIDEGGEALPGYGVAWRSGGRDAVVLMPVPLNLIARALRNFWLEVKYPTWGRRVDVWSIAFERGRSQGVAEGRGIGPLTHVTVLQPELTYPEIDAFIKMQQQTIFQLERENYQLRHMPSTYLSDRME